MKTLEGSRAITPAYRSVPRSATVSRNRPFMDALLIEAMAEACRIQPGCLEASCVHANSVCEQRSLRAVQNFCQEHEILRTYGIINSRRIPHRAVLVATEILGSDRWLTTEQLEQKSKYHLLMSVQMTAQWLLDDTVDVHSRIDGQVAADIVNFYLAVLEANADMSETMLALRAACLNNGIPENFVGVLWLLAQWQRQLALAVNISLAPQSLYTVLNQEFLMSSIQNHDVFDSWELYTQYRAANSGLSLEMLCGAYWFCHLCNIEADVIEQESDKYIKIFYKYSIIGGVSNDLFGYDKDLAEAVTTSVEVVKCHLSKTTFNSDDQTTKAFSHIIEFHNQRLEELTKHLSCCEDAAEMAVLYSALTTTRAIRQLHHEFMAIYQPISLQKVLG